MSRPSSRPPPSEAALFRRLDELLADDADPSADEVDGWSLAEAFTAERSEP